MSKANTCKQKQSINLNQNNKNTISSKNKKNIMQQPAKKNTCKQSINNDDNN